MFIEATTNWKSGFISPWNAELRNLIKIFKHWTESQSVDFLTTLSHEYGTEALKKI